MSKRKKRQSKQLDDEVFLNFGLGKTVHEYHTMDVFERGYDVDEVSSVPESIRLLEATHGRPTKEQWKTVMTDDQIFGDGDNNHHNEEELFETRSIVVTSEQRFEASNGDDEAAVGSSTSSEEVITAKPKQIFWQDYREIAGIAALAFCPHHALALELETALAQYRGKRKKNWTRVMESFSAVPYEIESPSVQSLIGRYYRFTGVQLFIVLWLLQDSTLHNFVFIPAE
jgi:hypothetical protein